MDVQKLVDILRNAFNKDLESHKKGHLCIEKLKSLSALQSLHTEYISHEV